MRFAVLVPCSLIACAVAMYACSSSDPATATPDAGKGTGTTSSTSSTGGGGDDDDNTSSSSSGDNTSSSSSGNASSSSGSTTSSSSSTSSSTGGPLVGADGGAGTKCEAGSIEEFEPNDTEPGQAVAGAGAFKACGKIAPGETDLYSFTYAAGTNGWGFGASTTGAGIKVEGIVDGVTYLISNNTPADAIPDMPAKTDKVTVIKVTNTGAASIDYIVRFTKTP